MDIKEKRIAVSLFTSVLTILVYALYVYSYQIVSNPELLENNKFWGKTFLILIPIAIGIQILVQIIFAIIIKIISKDAEVDPIDDERDKLIELKAVKISHYLFLIGFMLAMATLAYGMQLWVMFIVLFSSGFVASVVNELARLYFYRKGI